MAILNLFLAASLAASALAGPVAVAKHRTCATRDLSSDEMQRLKRRQNKPDPGNTIELDAAFHFCCSSDADCPTDDVAKKELDLMNEFFGPAQITFNLKNTSRINDNRCSQTDVTDQNTMDNLKKDRHQGTTGTLNIVYLPTNEGPGTKGVCVIPPGNNIGRSLGGVDGCVVAMDTLPKGGKEKRQNGAGDITSVHEAGHWLGLQHADQQGGGTPSRNIMEPTQVPNAGIDYKFDQNQISELRQVAQARKDEGEANGEIKSGGNGDPLSGAKKTGSKGQKGSDVEGNPSGGGGGGGKQRQPSGAGGNNKKGNNNQNDRNQNNNNKKNQNKKPQASSTSSKSAPSSKATQKPKSNTATGPQSSGNKNKSPATGTKTGSQTPGKKGDGSDSVNDDAAQKTGGRKNTNSGDNGGNGGNGGNSGNSGNKKQNGDKNGSTKKGAQGDRNGSQGSRDDGESSDSGRTGGQTGGTKSGSQGSKGSDGGKGRKDASGADGPSGSASKGSNGQGRGSNREDGGDEASRGPAGGNGPQGGNGRNGPQSAGAREDAPEPQGQGRDGSQGLGASGGPSQGLQGPAQGVGGGESGAPES
ncbi:hypothetical protein HIM_05952 [Hirsutella minnesotensis 3608]|uniref:Peptidase M43 pregnancy-associated plasma-A domain-containing protein n=1 Tax=Hirsutella minnesotensis 3608 TaxID=1043627 RepID=A0A0F7ZZP9_9HYPO|nr:hypothetical protein HIM_05952 [Hirsutella minnesotensis 3608]